MMKMTKKGGNDSLSHEHKEKKTQFIFHMFMYEYIKLSYRTYKNKNGNQTHFVRIGYDYHLLLLFRLFINL